MMSIWKMIYDLEYWIHIGIGDDIVNSPDSRQEFKHLVEFEKARNTKPEKIPGQVLLRLKSEAEVIWFKRKTFWVLFGLSIKRLFRIR